MRCINCKFAVITDFKSLATPLLLYTNIQSWQKTHVSDVFVLFGDVFSPLATAFTSPSVVSDQCTEAHWRQKHRSCRTVWPTEMKLWVLLATNIDTRRSSLLCFQQAESPLFIPWVTVTVFGFTTLGLVIGFTLLAAVFHASPPT